MPRRAQLGEDWLLFIRLTDNRPPRLVQGINLSRPLEAYDSAAFSRAGELVADRQAILAAVKGQIGFDRQLAPASKRYAADIQNWQALQPLRCPGQRASLEGYLGYARVKIDCDQWKQSVSDEENVHVDTLIVPIEPEDRERLMRAARLGDAHSDSPAYHHPIRSLVNFPDTETERLLEEISGRSSKLCGFTFRNLIRVPYHSWRMDAEFNTIFGDPQPAGNGLASYDVTGIDVDAVMRRYEFHRKRLVDLGVLSHVAGSFPSLASDGSTARTDARSDFVNRMWVVFPHHRHYYLSGDGEFSAWVPADDATRWHEFLNSESSPTQ